jgi:two-component system sensor histidine kinase DctS
MLVAMEKPLTASPRLMQPGWVWTAANVGLALVVVLLVTFVWLSHSWELAEQRRKLISDILWAGQNFSFHLRGDRELLAALGQATLTQGLTTREFEQRVQHLRADNPEVVQVTLIDPRGELVMMSPGAYDTDDAAAAIAIGKTRDAQATALRLAEPVWSDAYPAGRSETRFALVVPVYLNGAMTGQIIGEYSLAGMMDHLVPWWYAEQYHLDVLDSNGNVLATKSNVKVDEPNLTYDAPLDPPTNGLTLRATAYSTESGLPRNLFLAGTIMLSLMVLWSLLALRRDTLRRLAAEHEVSSQHAFRQAMEDSMLAGIVVRDLGGRLTYVNPAFCRMTGYAPEELLGNAPPFADAPLPPADRAPDGDAATGASHKGFESTITRRNGGVIDVLMDVAPLVDAHGRQSGWMSSILNVTERKRAQELARQQSEQLQFTSRLVTMGEMASTLAHELNQPLSAITSYVTGMLNRLDQGTLRPPELRQVLETTATQARRAGRIVNRVHEFVRRREPHRGRCDINQVAEEATGFLEAEARRSGTRIRLDLGRAIPHLHADSVLLEQVVLNLAKNGIEAMHDVPVGSRELGVRTESSGGTVTVSISDRGCGIAPDMVQKLFSPFFTTKQAGMGMGLNICRSIVEFHSGKLWFEHNQSGGSVFRFSLPVAMA